jgi:hypothetical protein
MNVGTGAILERTKGNMDSVIVAILQRDNQEEGKTQIHILHTSTQQAQVTVRETTTK